MSSIQSSFEPRTKLTTRLSCVYHPIQKGVTTLDFFLNAELLGVSAGLAQNPLDFEWSKEKQRLQGEVTVDLFLIRLRTCA